LLLVGCCLMDGRGRSELLFSVFWRSPSAETIFTGKSETNILEIKKKENRKENSVFL
jgi:hypothetical protein